MAMETREIRPTFFDQCEILPINASSDSSSTLERLPTNYQIHVGMHPTDSNSNPRCTIILKVEQARADTTGDIVYTDRFDSEEWELDYSCTAEQIKFEIGNLLDRFRITDGDYVESISERLSVDAAAHLQQAETLGVSVVIMEYVCISRKLERMRYLHGGEDEVCCGICMEGIVGEDKVIKMKCSHILHSHCLERWLQVGYSCPLCRRHLKLVNDVD